MGDVPLNPENTQFGQKLVDSAAPLPERPTVEEYNLARTRQEKQTIRTASYRHLVWSRFEGDRQTIDGGDILMVHSYGVEVGLARYTNIIVPWHQVVEFSFNAEDRICRGDK